MALDDSDYIPPVLDPARSCTPHSCPTVRPSAEEAEALDVFEAALREDEYTARLDNVARSFRGGKWPTHEGDL